MRTAAYLLVGCVLVLLQGTMHRFFAGMDSFAAATFGVHWLGKAFHGATPSLALPFVIYLGIHEHSMARGALLSFALGWALDIFGGGPAFLFRFTSVAVWWTCRAVSTRVSAQSTMTRIPLAFAASLLESAIILMLLAIFGADNRRPLELSSIVLPRAVSTAIFAYFLFPLAHRLNLESRGPQVSPTNQGAK
jgi:rod shape-determining protein MreD